MAIGESINLPVGKATRVAFGETLASLGGEDHDLVVVDADLNNSTRTDFFLKAYPERFFNVGIAESNMVGIAGGLAACGKKPWISSFAAFMMCNAHDQLRLSVAYPRLNVKVVGSHSGISIGADGPSQMGIEDLALASALPGFRVVAPCDEVSCAALTRALHASKGPAYLRTGRPNAPIIYQTGAELAIGRANVIREGSDITVIAHGLMVAAALEAAAALQANGASARVIDMHTIKPLDEDALAGAAHETGRIVVAEEHLAHGGLGSAVAMCVARHHPVPMRFVNLGDRFAESGDPDAVLDAYGMNYQSIVAAAEELL